MLPSLFAISHILTRHNGRTSRRHETRLLADRDGVDRLYDGPQGAMLRVASVLSGNASAAERIFRDGMFNLRGLRSLLDVGSGAGQLARPIVRYADAETEITCCDLSNNMLRRARARLQSDRPRFVLGNLSQLPFADGSFDGITCGYVLEHLPNSRDGLAELARVLTPGGRMLLLTMEDNAFGSLTSRVWSCRVHNREELRRQCGHVGLKWWKEFNVPRWHQVPWIDGICAEIRKPGGSMRLRRTRRSRLRSGLV